MKNVVLLGSTGSIGTSTAKVAEDLPDDIRIVGLAAGGNDALLAQQAAQFQPELVSIGSHEKAESLRSQLDDRVRVAHGEEGLIELATLPSADIVLISSDLSDLVHTLHVARRARRIVMANFVGTIAIDLVGIVLASFGLLSPVAAAFIHVGSETAFILNSARLIPRRRVGAKVQSG